MGYALRRRQELGRVEASMTGIVARCKSQGGRGLNAREREEWDRLTAQHTTLQNQIAREESGTPRNGASVTFDGDNIPTVEEMADTFRASPKQQRERHQTPHDQAFSAFLRNGINQISEEDRALVTQGANQSAIQSFARMGAGAYQNAQSTSPGSAGGYIIPQGFSDQLMEALKWFGGIDGVCGEFTTDSGNPFPWPTVNDTTNMGRIIGQNVQNVETDVTFGQVTFNAYIGSSDIVLIPLALLQDSYFDLNALLAKLLGMRLGRLLNYKCTVGTGTGEPTGIVTASVAAGNVVSLSSATTVDYSDLVALEGAVDPSYRETDSSRWMFPDAQLQNIKKLVDGNDRPLWQPGLTASFGTGASVTMGSPKPTILGHPYVINQNMAAPATNAYSTLFGDMSTFKLRKVGRLELMVLQERYADYLQRGYIAWMRFDSNLIDAGTHPIAVGQQS